MVDDKSIITIRQKKFDSLAARFIHQKKIFWPKFFSILVDFLAIGIPIAYFPVRLLAKNTNLRSPVEIIWELVAGLLSFIAFFKIAFKLPEKAQEHINLMNENIYLIFEADRLLKEKNLTDKKFDGFMKMAEKSEIEDRNSLSKVPLKLRQEAFREALKEIDPTNKNVVCPFCGASPYRFIPGECQPCGNTPQISTEGISK